MREPSRVDTSPLARWWWSIDRVGVALLLSIVVIGMVLLLAAGPPAAARLGIDNDFHFPLRQTAFLVPALAALFLVSTLPPLQARRLGVIVFIGALILMVATLLIGAERNGAHRWLDFGPVSLQPSEFLKPGFIIAAAWMMAEGARNPKFPGAAISLALYFLCAALLVMQPDYGQAALVTAVWMVMFFIAGWSWLWLIGLGIVGVSAMVGGYYFSPHVADRINGFLSPGASETFQVDKAQEAIIAGGRFGRGANDSVVKQHLPDAHTDFIFAVAAEEFGYFLCVAILLLFAALVIRLFMKAATMRSLFAQTASCGLAAMVGLQSFINIGVSLRALPAKGMTLPFISYGGSSLLAMGLTLGLAFSLTRVAPPAHRRKEIMP